MNNKFRLIKQTENGEVEKEYKTLKEISDELNVEIHIIRKINKLTEGRVNSIKPHNSHKELYEKYHDKGLEIIAICFEPGEDLEVIKAKLEKYKTRNGVDFTFVYGGGPSRKAANEVFPMLDEVKSFPTSIYLGKDGKVQKIYTGFNGPGTGVYYEKYVEETYKVIEGMLK